MWYEETHNDLFDHDKFALITNIDEKEKVVVKTTVFVETERFDLNKIVMQGSVFGPIKCSIQIDTHGRDCF